MDYGMLPPEINSARMYSGPGSASMHAAASAWDELATELGAAAVSYSSAISGLTTGWRGPSSESMAAAAVPYVAWLHSTAGQAEETANQARAAAGAYEAALAMTVPPPLIAANRAQLMSLIATNVLGQNAPAIAATEAQYGEMWAQDAAAMYGYAGSAAAASQVTPFTQPPPTTASNDSSGLTSPSSTSSAPSLSSVTSSLNALAIPARFATYPLTFLMRGLSFAKAGSAPAAAAASTVKAAGSSLAAGLTSLATPLTAASGPAASAAMGRAVSLGPLSVPTSWTTAGTVNPLAASFPPTSLSAAGVNGTAGVPPMMPIANMAGRTAAGAPSQYDMRPTVIPRSPSAG